jgi:2-(1,2-epoxy-1,2-dihydrophenyl)acetyl-CoA isomerase
MDEGHDGAVRIEFPADGIARVTLDRPQRLNAITPTMREALIQAVITLQADVSVRAIVLTGRGEHFCAGGDVARLAELPKSELPALLRSAHRLIRALVESEKPVIAVVRGAAAGGGAGLALACDRVLLASDASVVLPFNRLGLVADYGLAYTLPRRLGVARAHQLMLAPHRIQAEEALDIGLADDVCAVDALQEQALNWALRVSKESALALAWTKRLLLAQLPSLQATLELEVAAQTECFASEAFTLGAAAFLARTPR